MKEPKRNRTSGMSNKKKLMKRKKPKKLGNLGKIIK